MDFQSHSKDRQLAGMARPVERSPFACLHAHLHVVWQLLENLALVADPSLSVLVLEKLHTASLSSAQTHQVN